MSDGRLTASDSETAGAGSDGGALKILLALLLGPLLLGGLWSLMGPGKKFVGTWLSQQGGATDIFRFDADGTYWQHVDGGFISMHLEGSYEVVSSQGSSQRIRLKTQVGEMDMEYRPEPPDRLLVSDPDQPDGTAESFRRVGDWILAKRPSATASDYDGATPHIGCWQRRGVEGPELELLTDGTWLEQSSQGPVERATYRVDYSQVPFEIDVTNPTGEVDREIFDFAADGSLRISQTQLADGQRPQAMSRQQTYYPCPTTEPKGDA